MNNGTMNFKGKLESVNKFEGEKKPYLKIRAKREDQENGWTYLYHAPYKYKDLTEMAAHIEETKQGLLPLIDSEIAFTYTENHVEGNKYPYKNIKEFTVEFKTGGGKVNEEFVKDEAPDSETMKTLKEPTTTRPSDKTKPGLTIDLRKRKITLMVGLARTINLGDYNTMRPEFRIEEQIEGDADYIEKIKDGWLEKMRLWIDEEEAKHR